MAQKLQETVFFGSLHRFNDFRGCRYSNFLSAGGNALEYHPVFLLLFILLGNLGGGSFGRISQKIIRRPFSDCSFDDPDDDWNTQALFTVTATGHGLKR